MSSPAQTILVVENDSWLRRLLQRALEDAGYDVVVAANADDARREIHETHLDLVVTDLHLPDGNGLDLVAEAHRAEPFLPVLVMSAGLRGQDDALRRVIDSVGVHGLLEKPFSLEFLLRAVRRSFRPPE